MITRMVFGFHCLSKHVLFLHTLFKITHFHYFSKVSPVFLLKHCNVPAHLEQTFVFLLLSIHKVYNNHIKISVLVHFSKSLPYIFCPLMCLLHLQ
jgi:hypothetical protein